MIDRVTSDEDKVALVYKLEEICELLRSSDAGIVKEVADYIFKRIDHKSPVVKQKVRWWLCFSVEVEVEVAFFKQDGYERESWLQK